MTKPHCLLLLILDGWGVRADTPDNAISIARTPNWDWLWQRCPHALLDTSGQAVGLPPGQMGNSEVGHMNIGAGRIVYQELTRIGRAIEQDDFRQNPALIETIAATDEGTVHVLGLLSPGGVHSHEEHMLAAIALAADRHDGPVAVHAFTDGRDVPPRSAEASLKKLQRFVDDYGNVEIASISGRYFAMDRDQRWDRTEKAWQAIVNARADYKADSAMGALQAAYERDENDEFVQPTVIDGGRQVRDGDSAIFINFRADRARQLSRALTDPDFDQFAAARPQLAAFATMTRYEEDLPARVAFPPAQLDHLLGEELANAGIRQLRIAETEKYAHVTYFFNGGRERVFNGERRQMIPSPDVATYDLQPEMSAPRLAAELVAAIAGGEFPVIVCNVANPDMVGHSGIMEAAVEAVEAVDVLLGQVIAAIDEHGGELLVTADHGNVEQMSDPDTGQPHTAHTVNPVPLVFLGRPAQMGRRGSLRDIAPTMLDLLSLPIPDAMTGRALVHVGVEPAAASEDAG